MLDRDAQLERAVKHVHRYVVTKIEPGTDKSGAAYWRRFSECKGRRTDPGCGAWFTEGSFTRFTDRIGIGDEART